MNNAIMLAGARVLAGGEGGAAGGDVFDRIAAVLDAFYDRLLTVAVPLAILAIAFCAFKMFLASDPQSVKSAKNWLITIGIGLLIFLIAPAVVSTIQSIVG